MNAVVSAVAFVWLGMILAISFVEAPLKFRAPGITVPLGVGIGRLVFRALNECEEVLAVVIAIALVVGPRNPLTMTLFGFAVADLLACVVLRRLMDRRVSSGQVSERMPRSRLHFGYIALEVVKAGLLVALGAAALA
ncbi:hypothetical protein GCM10027289_02630 [Tsukamurella serpentis]